MMKCFGHLFILFTAVGLILCDSTESEKHGGAIYCSDLSPQNNLDIDQILGSWFGEEIITHNGDGTEGTFYFNTCVRITISNTSDQMPSTEMNLRDYKSYTRQHESPRHYYYLRLFWEEIGSQLEYILRYESVRRGFWLTSGPQKGSMVDQRYKQFRGSIQVMKAVGNHIVLTFCNSIPGSQLFSIILARRAESLATQDLEDIRRLLQRRGLSTTTIRKVCTSGAWNKDLSSVLLVLAFVLSKCF